VPAAAVEAGGPAGHVYDGRRAGRGLGAPRRGRAGRGHRFGPAAHPRRIHQLDGAALDAVIAPDERAAAQYYPGNYW